MRPYLAIISDTQLHKRLYGLTETRQDWFDAFDSAIDQVIEIIDQISAVILPGDILDQEEVGSGAAFTVTKGLTRLAKYNVPVLMLLGNHDQPENQKYNWVKMLQLVNPNVVEPSLENPLILEGCDSYKQLLLYGVHHMDRKDIIPAIEGLKKVNVQGEHWLVLHESLKELAPHPDAFEISAKNVPSFIKKVILGDFHDFDIYEDELKRQFIYPGSTETVSFNQTKTPGFILINRITNDIIHKSTQQREYITINLESIPVDKWELFVNSNIQRSIDKFKKAPILRIYYPSDEWDAYSSLKTRISKKVLKIFDYAANEITPEAEATVVREARIPTCKEELLTIATEEINALSIENKEDVIKILHNPTSLTEIQQEKFPEILLKNDTN